MEETLTVLDVIDRSETFLSSKNIANARRQAEWLISGALGIGRMQLYLQHDRPLAQIDLAKMRSYVARRGQGEPLQYVLGEASFHDLTLKVDHRVLIPRPETEQLVALCIESLPDKEAPLKILDLGTGSGAIALAIAAHFPQATVLAIDKSQDALDLAQENAGTANLLDRVEFLKSDWTSEVPPDACFDVILANPPYLTEQEVEAAEQEVKDFEPISALVSGDSGMRDLAQIIEQAYGFLNADGSLWLETGIEQRETLLKKCHEVGYAESEGLDDWSGRQRFIRARKA